MIERLDCDVLVVGSGGAGTAAACAAMEQGASVILVSKDPMVCSDTKISEGIISVRASGGEDDTPEALSRNLRVQGDDLAEPELPRVFAEDSRATYDWLQSQGLVSEQDQQGHPLPLSIPMGGHTHARSVPHRNGGLDMGHALWHAIHTSGEHQQPLTTLEDAWVLELYRTEQGVVGALIYQAKTGRFVSIRAPSTVLACGGVSTLYFPNTDTMRGNTGDAYALALKAGAQLVDMEQIQFIPFAAVKPAAYRGLIVGEPIITGLKGKLRDANGKVILAEMMGRTRAECAAAIARAVARGDGSEHQACFLDLRDNLQGGAGEEYLALMRARIPGILNVVKASMGKAAARFEQAWEVRPSAHYCMGGVRATAKGEAIGDNEQVIAGLYVAGQAMGGLHGSNRLGSTSLAETAIFGRRAGRAAALRAQAGVQKPSINEQESRWLAHYRARFGQKGRHGPIALMRSLQKCCWEGIGPARDAEGIKAVLTHITATRSKLADLCIDADPIWNQAFIDSVELENLLACAEAIALSASHRRASLGAHVRLDETKGRADAHGSLCVFRQGQQLQLMTLPRSRSSRLDTLRVKGYQALKVRGIRLINRLPMTLQDALVAKMYRRARGGGAHVGDRQDAKTDSHSKMGSVPR